ncbi:PAS domain-containing protein [Echinicola jeungdonensis]|uniref:histidine kinase n=1 Tax=Echinicola jeungdonensis TaxID=709343 RepID=A0ABV5J7S4_9BACT|nr:PAS domain-containing protein [Echinicola jeungdonensis]MDN3669126.1 PAS domain-containing protein [Echinicola jeungdonensis]
MAINSGAIQQNILLTLKRNSFCDFDLLHISPAFERLGNVLDKKKDCLEHFDSVFPTLERPALETLFQSAKREKALETFLFSEPHIFQKVNISGYTLSENPEQNCLVNLLIAPVAFNPEINLQWIIHPDGKTVYFNKEDIASVRPKNTSDLANFLELKFHFLKKESISSFLKSKGTDQLVVYPDHIILKKEELYQGYELISICYTIDENDQTNYFNEDKEQLIRANSGVIYYEHEVGDKRINWSGAIKEILGYSLEEFKRVCILDWGEFIHQEDLPSLYTGFESEFLAKSVCEVVYRMRHKNGQYIYVQDTARTFFNENTGKKMVIGMIKDISQLKEIEEDLAENQFKLNQLTGVVPGAVYMLKTKDLGSHQFIFLSEGIYQLLEVEPKDFGKDYEKLMEMVHPEDLGKLIEADKNAIETDSKFENYFRIVLPNGKIKWLYGAANRLHQYTQEGIWAGFIVDVTYTKQKEEEAQLNFLRYKSIYDNTPLSILHLDTEGKITSVNQSFIKKFGITNESMILGKNILDYQDKQPLFNAFKDAFNTGSGFYEGPYISDFSNSFFYIKLMVEKTDHETGYQATLEDITEKEFTNQVLSRVAEISAQFNEVDFFEEVVKLLSIKLNLEFCLIGEFEPNTESIKTIAVAKGGKIIPNFKYSLVGTPCMKSIASNDEVTMICENVAEKYPDDHFLIEHKIQSYGSIAIKDKSGKKIGILTLMDTQPIQNQIGVSNIITILGDRTGAELQRLKYEKELRESEQLYRSIAENFPQGTVDVLDKNFRYIYTEGKEYEKENINPADLIGENHFSKFCPNTAQKAKYYLDKVFNNQTVTYEISYGGQHYLKFGVPLQNNAGEIDRVLLVTQNISEIKEAECERERLIQDLKSHNEELQRFAYIVSHNLRAPIVNITALLEMLNYENLNDPDNQEVIKNLKVSTSILNTTLNDLIEVISIRKQKIPKIETISFSQLVHNVEKSLFKQISDTQVKIKKDFSQVKEINYVYAHLENFLLNFMTNSIKYRHPDRVPEIQITTRMQDDYCVLSFSDNGIGIDLERYKDRLFGLYQRFHSHIEGKGLGLYLVREQLRVHDGKIEIESEVNEGSTFWVFLKNMKPSQDTTAKQNTLFDN